MVKQLCNQAVIHQQDIFRNDLQKCCLVPDISITVHMSDFSLRKTKPEYQAT